MLKIHQTDTHYRIESDYYFLWKDWGGLSRQDCETIWIHKDPKVFDPICFCGHELKNNSFGWHNGGTHCDNCILMIDFDWDEYKFIYENRFLKESILIKCIRKEVARYGRQFLREYKKC